MLETVPEIVAAAVAAGAAAGLKETAARAVGDAYRQVKSLITGRYRQVDLAAVEARPASAHRRDELAEDLTAAGASGDAELLAAAQALLAAVRAHEADAGVAVGVDLERVQAAALRVREVESTGTGVRVVDGSFDGDIEIGSVRAGRQDPPPAHP
ncbi:hypothetical protein [Nocardia sp. BMG111209]|uniref:hypothetical protein n=1 Tax=Nocardia sp. BMG111209 TaxID=1160137 RepID=UPI0003A49737|nr:hypothetical protein [Nocardia sp. BMG111209]